MSATGTATLEHDAPNREAKGSGQEQQQQQQQQNNIQVTEREAYDYWGGMLFKADKTGTDRLKSLLRGLKDIINEQYRSSDNPDLMPEQIASFYRDLNGDYNQLFLGTPGASIAFIYKSLGCTYSLQPMAQSTTFVEPTVPALKTEGWIMWQTIQLLLGPDEHSTFLTEAVKRWDVKDPITGETFPKVLPRQCFPAEPDKHMVAWYEGVSERLRREAEDEERQRAIEAEQTEPRRVTVRRDDTTDDEGSVDSRGPALAYFRNPLYRHMDGRPSIVRRSSKRPPLSPRQSMMDKGKEAAATFGHVVRNVASPHLWDGPGSSSGSRERDRRRRSVPDHRHHFPGEEPPTEAGAYDNDDRNHLLPARHAVSPHHRRGSRQLERPPSSQTDGSWDGDGRDSAYSPNPGHSPRASPGLHRHQRPGSHDPSLRHSRSHEPTPSQREYEDYFQGADSGGRRRRPSALEGSPVQPTQPSIGPSFGPSNAPPFAAQVARQTPAPPPEGYRPHRRPGSDMRDPPRPYSRDRLDGPRRNDRRDDRRGPSLGREGSRPPYDDRRPEFDEPRRSRDRNETPSPHRGGHRRSGSGRHGGGSDVDAAYSASEDRERRPRPKQTRFAQQPIAGVDGRRYPTESPWR